MPSILAEFKRTSVTVQTYAGADGNGDLFAAAVIRRPMVENKRRQVRSAADETVLSETMLYDDLSADAIYTPGSIVTLDGRPRYVIVSARMDALDDPDIDHVQVALR